VASVDSKFDRSKRWWQVLNVESSKIDQEEVKRNIKTGFLDYDGRTFITPVFTSAPRTTIFEPLTSISNNTLNILTPYCTLINRRRSSK
jgi:hypothetical protein